jgi:hypothetical protein
VTLFISSGDQALKKLRDLKHWTALVAACPLYAHWLDGEPITDVLPWAAPSTVTDVSSWAAFRWRQGSSV